MVPGNSHHSLAWLWQIHILLLGQLVIFFCLYCCITQQKWSCRLWSGEALWPCFSGAWEWKFGKTLALPYLNQGFSPYKGHLRASILLAIYFWEVVLAWRKMSSPLIWCRKRCLRLGGCWCRKEAVSLKCSLEERQKCVLNVSSLAGAALRTGGLLRTQIGTQRNSAIFKGLARAEMKGWVTFQALCTGIWEDAFSACCNSLQKDSAPLKLVMSVQFQNRPPVR